MKRFFLTIVFLAGGLAGVFPLLVKQTPLENLPFPDRMVCIPAVLIGIVSWMRRPLFARSWPVLICLAISFFGVLMVDESERGRGLLIFSGLATAIPISALIVEQNAARLCAKVFIFSTLLSMLAIVYLGGLQGYERFGHLMVDGLPISNPNAVAAQMGLAAVITMALMRLGKGDSLHQRKARTSLLNEQTLLVLVLALLGLGILLSASRGAILSITAVVLFAVASSTTKLFYRVLSLSSFAVTLLFIIATENGIISRFQDTGGLAAVGDRMPIWQEALRLSQGDALTQWMGVGTGGTEKRLAEGSNIDLMARIGLDDVERKATHNSYIEWLLSHGFVGVAAAALLLIHAVKCAWRLDSVDRSIDRRALIIYCLVISMVTSIYRTSYVIQLGAILLSMLSGPFIAPWPRVKSESKRENTRPRSRAVAERRIKVGTRQPSRLSRA